MHLTPAPSPRPRGPLYRMSLPPLIAPRTGAPRELVAAFGAELARWIDAQDLAFGETGVRRFLDWAAPALTCEEVNVCADA